MTKKYTCAGMNSGGRVKGYADGGAVKDIASAAASGAMAGGANAIREMNAPMRRMKHVSEEVDDAISRQKASDDRSRAGKPAYRHGGKV